VKFYDFVQLNRLLLCFSAGLLSTLLFSETYFWVSSIAIGSSALFFTHKLTSFVGLSLGLSVGAYHFLNFVEVAPDNHCFQEAFKFTGEVSDFPVSLMGKSGDVISLLTLQIIETTAADDCPSMRTITAVVVDPDDQQYLLPGDVVAGHARLNRPDYRWMRGSLPRNIQSWSEGIEAQLTIQSIDKIKHGEGALLSAIRVSLADFIHGNATSERAMRHLSGLLLGRQDALQEEDWLNLRTFGMTHAFVVSGLHLGLVALWMRILVSGITRLLATSAVVTLRLLQVVGVCIVSYVYVVLTGASLPAERALLMISIALFARTVLWSVEPLSIVMATGAILLAINPLSALTPGFWLSLVLTGVIIAFVSRPVSGKLRSWLILHSLIVAVSSVLTLMFFSQITWAGFFANVFLVPLLTLIALPLGLIGLSLMSVGLELGGYFLSASSLCLELLLKGMDYVVSVAGDGMLQAVWLHPGIFIIALIAWLTFQFPRTIRMCFGCCLFFTFSSTSPDSNRVYLQVTDVGQGTAVVIRSGNAVMLYDTGGESFTGRPVIERGFVRWLRQNGISAIDLLIVSHGDTDHSGGLTEIGKYFDVQRHYGFAGNACVPGKEISLGQDVHIQFLAGTGHRLDSSNDDSCVISLTIFQSNILLPGDVSRSVELDLLAFRQLAAPLTLLIAAHHGSNTSSGAHFIDQVAPAHTVFTTEYGHQFGHPHPAVRERFRRRGVTLWDTGVRAGIDFEFLPNNRLSVSPMRTSLTPYWASGPPLN
jgi:competence protein ComEC